MHRSDSLPSFEARKSAHLRMTEERLWLDEIKRILWKTNIMLSYRTNVLTLTALALIAGASAAQARITQVVIKTVESPTFGGKTFGAVGAYERISGQVIGE